MPNLEHSLIRQSDIPPNLGHEALAFHTNVISNRQQDACLSSQHQANIVLTLATSAFGAY